MSEEISVQILSKASENIQKLFDLSTRIDERVKIIQDKADHLDRRIDGMVNEHLKMIEKVAVLESKSFDAAGCKTKIEEVRKESLDLEKRVMKIESVNAHHTDRWNKIGAFFIQLIWVILAAYLLTKLNLQAPAVP